MIFLYHGTDRIASRNKAREVIDVMHSKRPDAEIFILTTENWHDGSLDELVSAQGLFEKKYIILCDNLCEKKDSKEIVIDKLKELKESENAFIFIENTADAKTIEKIAKLAEKSQEFAEKAKAKDEFNMFSLAEALGKKDKKSLWVLYQKALAKNISPEEIHGILFWQIKTMMLASTASSAESADLKPFVYSKAKAYLKNFPPNTIPHVSSKLVQVYHNSRRGLGEFETNLERFILEL
jgi:DNA polymerase III delta subunit